MFCMSCGARLPEGAAFCPSCGARISETPAEAKGQPETAPPPTVCPNCGSNRLKRIRRGEYRCEHCESRFFSGEQGGEESAEEIEAKVAAIFTQAEAYADKGEYSEELRALTGALEIAPDNSDLLLRIGRAHWRLGQMKKALEYYEKAAQLSPGDPICYTNIASLYLSQREFAQAKVQFEKGLKVYEADPLSASAGDMAVVYGNYAWCIGELGDLAGAKRYLSLAKKKGYSQSSIENICARLHLNPKRL